MRALALVAALTAGCYAPSARPGAPCGPGDSCPTGQECRSGVCYATGTPDDASEEDVDAPIDSAQITVDAPPDSPAYIPWSTPVVLASLETPGADESDPSVTTDRLTVVLCAETAANDDDIYIGTRAAVTDTFTPTLLTALNAATFNDESPEISGDGKTIYFTSNRSGGDDVYISTFSTVWSTPVVAADLSSTSNDSDVAISPDGLTAVVLRTGAPNRFYIHTRASTAVVFGTGAVHTELNVTTDIAAPSITNGGATIYFHAGVSRDLYVATRTGNGTYTTPQPISELNTANVRDAAPFVLEGDNYMIFDRGHDIYETTR